jgi:outer membrane lipoprotein SlyB
MLPPEVTGFFERLTSAITVFGAIVLTGAVVGGILAHSFGGGSPIKRQAILGISGFLSLCAASYYMMSKLGASG